MKKIYFLTLFVSTLVALTIDCTAQSSKQEILDYHIAAFNQRDIEKYVHHMHDSIRIVTFPNKISQNNINDVRAAYSSAFNATSLGGQMRVVERSKFGDYFIQEEWLEGFNSDPVMNYVLYKFKADEIIEIVYLPKNWKPTH